MSSSRPVGPCTAPAGPERSIPMDNPVFREKSMERISSPEQLNDYLRVTSPAVWAALAAVILLLVCLFAWSAVTAVESFAAGTAEARDGVLTITFDDPSKAGHVKAGMEVKVGALTTDIVSVGEDEDGALFAVAELGLPDGSYQAKVGYDKMQIIGLLMN